MSDRQMVMWAPNRTRCWCGSGKARRGCHGTSSNFARARVELGAVGELRSVPASIQRPDYVADGRIATPGGFQIQTEESLGRLRAASRVAADVLAATGVHVRPGVTTDELDAVAHETYLAHGAYPSTLGYHGFPKSICTSVNGVICHGIPDDRPLEEGDIVNIDVTAYLDGMHGDTSATFAVGEVDPSVQSLIDVTRAATLRGIAAVSPGVPLQAVAEAIEPFAHDHGFLVVGEYGGHGIGQTFHAEPHVDHRVPGRRRLRRASPMLEVGMTLTVEPMLLSGGRAFSQADDGWTEHADDNMVSAQFEHTVVVTDDGVEILTITEAGDSAAGTLAG